MLDPTTEEGTIQVLLVRLNEWWIPRALKLQGRVNGGATLDEFDIAFLERVLGAADEARELVAHHPDLRPLAHKVIGLYGEIIQKALENEDPK